MYVLYECTHYEPLSPFIASEKSQSWSHSVNWPLPRIFCNPLPIQTTKSAVASATYRLKKNDFHCSRFVYERSLAMDRVEISRHSNDFFIVWTQYIGGSRGGREGRTPPPGRPNSFDFMQFSGKFGVFTPPLEGSRPPLGKILDPPLQYTGSRLQRGG